jgi:hypothetical protein
MDHHGKGKGGMDHGKDKGGKDGKGPGSLSGKHKTILQQHIHTHGGSMKPQAKAAMQKVVAGTKLSPQERENLAGMLGSGTLSPEVQQALTEALTLDGMHVALHRSKYLRLHNPTKESMTVFVQYHTYTAKKEWKWFPAQPGAEKAVAYQLRPGQSLRATHEKWAIHADKARIWARSASGKEWTIYRGRDLVLVPKAYYAPETLDYTCKIDITAVVAGR